MQLAIQLVPCVLCVQIQNRFKLNDANAERVVVLFMDRIMIANHGPDTVKLGHSHVLNVQRKDISPRTAASAPLVVSGATVTLHPELVSNDRTVQVTSSTNCVL